MSKLVNLSTLNCKRIRFTLNVVRNGTIGIALYNPWYSPKIALRYLQKFSVERSVFRNVVKNRVEYMDGWLNK